MRAVKTFAAVLVGLSIGAYDVAAQGLSPSNQQPAEFPPSSYKGKQYVDSRGCVFVRAGFDGAVTWIPRVSRGRKLICGQKPSLPSLARADEPPAVAETPKPTATPAPQRVVRAPAPKPVTVKPKPVTVATAPAATAPAPTKPRTTIIRRPVQTATATPRAQAVTPAPAPAPTTQQPRRVVVQQERYVGGASASCSGAAKVSPGFINGGQFGPVRCGPQTISPGPVIVRQGSRILSREQANGRIVARVRSGTGNSLRAVEATNVQPVTVPEGYEAAWTDGRLNPLRGVGTADGDAQMALTWTKGLPRRLVEIRTGRDVTQNFPGLVYPYTSYQQQQAAGVSISTKGVVVKKVVRTRGTVKTKAVQPQTKVIKRKAVRTKAVAPKTTARAASHRFVQVGTFGVDANAQKSAARLQSMGLPVKLGVFKRGGKTYKIVLAGPFKSQKNLDIALAAAKRAGFKDAFLRK